LTGDPLNRHDLRALQFAGLPPADYLGQFQEDLSMKRALITAALTVATCAFGMVSASATATSTTVYKSTVAAPNLPSEGPQAYAFKELGDDVTLAGTARTLNNVRVELSSWACQQGTWDANDCYSAPGSKFSQKITVSLYDTPTTQSDGTVVPGDLLTRATNTFSIPYRPSANLAHCRGADLGKWWNTATAACYNGRATTVSFDFTSLKQVLPDEVVVGVSYNTTSAGPHPIGTGAACYGSDAGCAYDALNIALSPTIATGDKEYPGTVFQNTSQAGNLCDGTPALNEFNLDSPTNACWTGYNPAIMITAH
jgi:hypothetical protein